MSFLHSHYNNLSLLISRFGSRSFSKAFQAIGGLVLVHIALPEMALIAVAGQLIAGLVDISQNAIQRMLVMLRLIATKVCLDEEISLAVAYY